MIRKVMPAAAALLFALSGAPLLAQQASEAGKFLQRGSMARAKGVSSAPVLVYEIADFQCPFCAQFANTVAARLDSAFVKTGKVQWVFVNLPLPMHQNAWAAAEAAMCAGAAGNRFWPMHDKLYRMQAEWMSVDDPAQLLAGYAKDVGVPSDAYASCVAADKVASILLQDVVFAAGARVSGTPTFIINGEETVVGVKTYDEWKTIIEKAALKPRPKN